jgi:hypothetical protein
LPVSVFVLLRCYHTNPISNYINWINTIYFNNKTIFKHANDEQQFGATEKQQLIDEEKDELHRNCLFALWAFIEMKLTCLI